MIFEVLEKVEGYNKILSNLYLPRKDGSTTEVDLVVINQYGIYVIESKNYSGKIYGKEQYKFWNQYTNRSKNKFYNPVWQNNLHVNALKNVLNPDELEAVHSLIVFSNRSNIDKVEVNKPNIRIIQRKNLLETLNSDRFTLKKSYLSTNEIDNKYNELRKYALADELTKKLHVKNIQRKITQKRGA